MAPRNLEATKLVRHDDLVKKVKDELGLTHASCGGWTSFALGGLPVPWVRLPQAACHLRRRPDGALVNAEAKTLLLVEVDLSTCSYEERRWAYSVAAYLIPDWRVTLLIVNEYSRTELPLDEAARDHVIEMLAEHKRDIARLDAAFAEVAS